MVRRYVLSLSTKEKIHMDEEDAQKVIEHIGDKVFIKTKEAIFNTAYIVSIVPEFVEETTNIEGYIDPVKKVFVVTGESKAIEAPKF
jgi:hypothetical protein